MHEHNHIHADIAEGADELKVLLEYMYSHNLSHLDELKSAAEQLRARGDSEAYAGVMKSVEKYDEGNALLKEALKAVK